ncbi:MAG: hypothetical protein Q8Q36_02265 [bacterium]|nr:hypothetical protein [bacterium]
MTARRKLLPPSRARRKRRVARLKQVFFTLVLFSGVLAFFLFLFREPSLRVNAVELSGAEAVPAEEILGVVNESLAGAYFRLVPKESVFFYPKGAIEEELAARFPRLARVELSLENFRALRVEVIERAPAYLWCGSAREIVTSECFSLDETGYVFDRPAVFSGSSLARFYGALAGEGDGAVGKRFLPENEFAELRRFLVAAEALGLAPSSLVKKGGQAGDYEISLKEGGTLLFTLDGGAEKPASNLESALDTDPLKKNMAAKRSALDYIDLRFGNKVFFKFR